MQAQIPSAGFSGINESSTTRVSIPTWILIHAKGRTRREKLIFAFGSLILILEWIEFKIFSPSHKTSKYLTFFLR